MCQLIERLVFLLHNFECFPICTESAPSLYLSIALSHSFDLAHDNQYKSLANIQVLHLYNVGKMSLITNIWKWKRKEKEVTILWYRLLTLLLLFLLHQENDRKTLYLIKICLIYFELQYWNIIFYQKNNKMNVSASTSTSLALAISIQL